MAGDVTELKVEASASAEYSILELREHFRQAVASGEREVVIPPGDYRGTTKDKAFIEILGARNLTIRAEGVRMICEKRTRALTIADCEDLTIRGLVIDYDPLPFTQGTITAVGPDDAWVDVTIHEGYPLEPYRRIDIVDSNTRHRKYGMPFLWGTSAEMRSGGIVRITRKGGFGGVASVGDLASLATGSTMDGMAHAISIEYSARVALKDITLHTAPGFGIVAGGGYGDHHYDNVRIVPGPPPAGATEGRLLTATWDAIQFNCLRKGPLVENCVVMSAGDDTWSLSSRDFLFLATEGRRAWLVSRSEYVDKLEPGDRLTSSQAGPSVRIESLAKVRLDECPLSPELREKIRTAEPGAFYRFPLSKINEVMLDSAPPWTPGTSLYSPDRNCSNFVLRNNTFHSSGRAGLINGASNGVIEGNTYLDVGTALSLYSNLPGGGATGMANIIFRNNIIRGSGHWCPKPNSLDAGGAVSIYDTDMEGAPAPPGVFRNITIENNLF
ncbi:MAG: right-handed parallel beta-helix repeat-containing protein, partial [Deltaproteobacteria bacterium]